MSLGSHFCLILLFFRVHWSYMPYNFGIYVSSGFFVSSRRLFCFGADLSVVALELTPRSLLLGITDLFSLSISTLPPPAHCTITFLSPMGSIEALFSIV